MTENYQKIEADVEQIGQEVESLAYSHLKSSDLANERMERTNKRWFIANVIQTIIIALLACLMILGYEETVEIQQDTQGEGSNMIIGGDLHGNTERNQNKNDQP